MRWKVFIVTLLLTVIAVAAPQSRRPAKLEHIKFGKCRIVSMTPTGLRSVRAGVEMETRNDTSAFVLEDVKLTIFRKGKPFVEGFCGEIKVPKGSSTVRATGEFELCDDVSLLSAVKVLSDPDMSEFTGDVDMTVVNAKGRKVAYSQQGVSMGSFSGKPKVESRKTETAQADVRTEQKDVKTGEKASPKDSGKTAADKTKKTRKRPWWQFWKK